MKSHKNKNKSRNALVKVMIKRHPRKQVMRHRLARRLKDYKNSWKKEWD